MPNPVHDLLVNVALFGDFDHWHTLREKRLNPLLRTEGGVPFPGFCRGISRGSSEHRGEVLVQLPNGFMQPTEGPVRIAIEQTIASKSVAVGYAQTGEVIAVTVTDDVGKSITERSKW